MITEVPDWRAAKEVRIRGGASERADKSRAKKDGTNVLLFVPGGQ
jgi:hypothetical protein